MPFPQIFLTHHYYHHNIQLLANHMKSIFQHSSLQNNSFSPISEGVDEQDTMSQQDGQIYQPSYWSSHFPSFIFQKLLDETSNSLIWKGCSQNDSEPVALKITQRFQNNTSEKYHQLSENKFISQHTLQNMAQVKQIVENGSYRLIVMKVYPWNLMNLLKQFTTKTNKKFTQQHIQFVIYSFKSILNAVQELHTLGYVHRDLKPDNFLVDSQFNVVVSDFGLVTKQLEVDLSISGTLQYLSPERLSKVRRQNPIKTSVDIWALGIILYELFTGQNPFNGDNEEEILQNICQGYVVNKQIPLSAINLIDGILEMSGQKRLSLQQIKNHPFLQKQVEKSKIVAYLSTCYY